MGAKLDNLQVLRGIACLAVVAYHVSDIEAGFGLGQNPLKPVRWFGYAGVDLFFVLSGFIIATTCRADLGRVDRLPRYLFRRFWRVYPPYWAALAVATVLYACLSETPLLGDRWPSEWLDTLLLFPQAPVPRILPVAWTLSYEVMFYLAFATLFVLPRWVAVPALLAWGIGVGVAMGTEFVPENRFARLAVSPFVLEFLIGCLAAVATVAISRRTALGILGLAAVWCVAGSALVYSADSTWLATHATPRVLVFGPAAGLVVFALAAYERGGGQLAWPRMIAVGDASYSVYLLHSPFLVLGTFLTLLVGWQQTKVLHVVWLFAAMAFAVLPAMAFHRWVEKPLLALGKPKRPERPATVPFPESTPARRAA